jgi:NADPH-dependent ferric siderophore reductase
MPEGFAHLAASVPSRPAGDLDDKQLLAKAHGSTHWDLTVEAIELAPRMLRVTMSAAGLEAMEWQPAQDLTVHVLRAAGRDIRRRYTIAAVQGDRVRLDVYMHGDGVGTAWARALRIGDTVSAIGPRGKLLLNQEAEWHLLIGDETSLPGIHAMLGATNRPAHVVVEVDIPTEWQSLGPGSRPATQWTWIERASLRRSTNVLAAPLPVGIGHAYVTGEASRVFGWRNRLQQMGFDESDISHKAYWGVGRANATHGEPLS